MGSVATVSGRTDSGGPDQALPGVEELSPGIGNEQQNLSLLEVNYFYIVELYCKVYIYGLTGRNASAKSLFIHPFQLRKPKDATPLVFQGSGSEVGH